jgi:hypothetical protein
MRKLVFSALVLSAFPLVGVGQTTEGAWTYIVENGGATITASTATGVVTIPSALGGHAVKKVGSGSFLPFFGGNANSVTSVAIPNSVTSIGDYAFYGCSSLTSVTLGNSVTSIGRFAFTSCMLTSITFPNSVTSIGDYAFNGCSSLTSLIIPNSITSINTGAFSSCSGLTSLIIPNSVTSIMDTAFELCSGLTSVTFGNSVTSIGLGAFRACSALTALTIPNSVTSIGLQAFMDCTNLSSVIISSSVTSIGENAFQGCNRITSITMPDRFIAQVAQIGISGQVATDYFVNALANNDAFVTAVANKILAKSGNYGLSVKSELGTLATKTELTSALTESRTAGVNSVLSNPNLWTLYTTSQIQNMAVGDLVLTRQVSGGFVLNYDIEQSTDLQTWTPYQALSLPMTNLPTDKAFVRIKAKQ